MPANTKKIKIKHPGITELPTGAWGDWKAGKLVEHFISVAKKKGRGPIMRSILNIERWNKNDNKPLSSKARGVINALKKSPEWNEIGSGSRAAKIAKAIQGIKKEPLFYLLVQIGYSLEVTPTADTQSCLLHLIIFCSHSCQAQGNVCSFLLNIAT